jgi:hypothetical protein
MNEKSFVEDEKEFLIFKRFFVSHCQVSKYCVNFGEKKIKIFKNLKTR